MVLPTDDEILMALDECGLRWVAWQHALTHVGPQADDDTWLAVIDLELAADSWRERFHGLVTRRGWTLDTALADEAGPFGLYVVPPAA